MRSQCLDVAVILLILLAAGSLFAQEVNEAGTEAPPYRVVLTDQEDFSVEGSVDEWIRPASLFQPQPFLTPRLQLQPQATLPGAASNLNATLFSTGLERSRLREARLGVSELGIDYVRGSEATVRSTTDIGNLLRKSPSAVSVETQRRTPIVNDPRIRGSRIGSLAANGSYWVPARIDLDTVLSKIDSRVIEDVVVIPGPYSSRLGPGLQFVDFQFASSPRFEEQRGIRGRTSVEHNANGSQWYGRQAVDIGNADRGVRLIYGDRVGSDYRSGNGTIIPAGYNSRDWLATIGRDLTDASSLEFNYVRLDQTGVDFPGYAFDMNYLVTDGFEATYLIVDQPAFDRFEVQGWYNRTRFQGDTLNPSKRVQFPLFASLSYDASTDVDSTSTGFSAATSWGDGECSHLTLGVDLRVVNQELNEISSGVIAGLPFAGANSPIPDSTVVNPGLFVEHLTSPNEKWKLRTGARADYAHANINIAGIAGMPVGAAMIPYEAIVGTADYDRDFGLWSTYATSEYEINQCWTALLATGYGERPPNLTELYAAEPFMFLLQNGLNTVTGDPNLQKERKLQVDLALKYHSEDLRAGARGFYSWVWDYIAFENFDFNPLFHQVNLKYVNTELATLAGGELFAEADLSSWCTPFATLKYVEGRDRTRNGDFATRQASGVMPSARIAGLARGSFGLTGGSQEPLPSISPLEANVGVRIHDVASDPSWALEVLVRIVDAQDRVAASLRETATGGFTVVDLRGYWRQTENLLWTAGVENVGNRNYREHLDFRIPGGFAVFQPGFNFYIGTELGY